MQPGNRYYLFKDLIRCNCLDVFQTIKFLILLYTARGFLSFCLPWGLNLSPSQGSSSAWAGGVHKHHCSPPAAMHSEQQPCRQLPACSCSTEDALMEERCPLGHLSSQGWPCWHRSERNRSPPSTQQGWEPQQKMNFCWPCPSLSASFSPRFHLLTWHWESILSLGAPQNEEFIFQHLVTAKITPNFSSAASVIPSLSAIAAPIQMLLPFQHQGSF